MAKFATRLEHMTMKIIAIEEAFAYPPAEEATGGGLGGIAVMRDSPWFQSIQKKLVDLADIRLADMDAAGIDVQVISYTAPGPQSLDPPQARDLSSAANDVLAEAVAAHPDRFAGLATLPLSDPDGAARELERAVLKLGYRGAIINGLVQGRFLDDPAFAPVLAQAERLKAPLYLHPSLPPQSVMQAYFGGLPPGHALSLATAAWGWHSETAIHVLRLILAGVFDRYPDLQLIIGHMGEMLPFSLARAEWALGAQSKHLRQPLSEYFQTNIWITTSGYFTYAPLQCALSVIGADRILFAIDYPYGSNEEGRRFLETVPISSGDRAKIAHKNAERLLRL
jgi:predicted TIM-barrel fold metal-dependent hydrolase